MKTNFDVDGVTLVLSPSEYGFVYLSLGHLLFGEDISENDFRSLLGMTKRDALTFFEELRDAERKSKGLA